MGNNNGTIYTRRFMQAVSDRYDACENKPPKSPSLSPIVYAHRLTQGMKAKKYKGGKAAAIKASTRRVFDQYFKPLPTP